MQYDLNSDRHDFSADIVTKDIERYFKEHNNGPFFSIFEVGTEELRFDLLRATPSIRDIKGFEFKVSRSDFLADKKWKKYLKHCNSFSFVCPYGMIKKEELPDGIGLLWIYKWKYKNSCGHWNLEGKWVKYSKKRSVRKDTMIDMAMMLTYKVKWRRKDIF